MMKREGGGRAVRRRAILGGIGVAGAAAALSWPEWLRTAFAGGVAKSEETCDMTPDPAAASTVDDQLDLGAAARRGACSGRRVVVFVIPAADSEKWDQGHVFGEYLNHGTDADLAPLARAEVVCATVADVRRLVPGLPASTGPKGEPLVLVLDPTAQPMTARAFDPPVQPLTGFDAGLGAAERKKADEEAIQSRIATVATVVRRALGATDSARVARDAAAVRKALVEKPPSGTRWARSRGCGVRVEGAPPAVVGCGMGHVPAKSERFLYFFTDGQTI